MRYRADDLIAVSCDRNAEPIRFEKELNHPPNEVVIIDDEDMGQWRGAGRVRKCFGRVHSCSIRDFAVKLLTRKRESIRTGRYLKPHSNRYIGRW
jgi:hypothetical protein